MNVFYVSFFLSKACLGEISKNFRMVSFAIYKKTITIFFILEEQNDEDEENITYEIMSLFDLWFYEFLESSGLDTKYDLKSEVLYNAEESLDFNCPHKYEYYETFYMRREY